MNLNHIKLGAHSTSICGNYVVKHILRSIYTCPTKQNKTDKGPKSSAVVKLRFVAFKRNFYTNSVWSLTNTSGLLKLIGVKGIAINLKQGRRHHSCTSYKVNGLLGIFPKGSVHSHVIKREASKTAGNVDNDPNQSFPNKANSSRQGLLPESDRQEEDGGASIQNINQPIYDKAVSGLSDYFQKNCEHGLKTLGDKTVTQPFKIYNKVTSNLDDLFPKIKNRYDININGNDDHATKIKKVPHLRVNSSIKNSLMPINNELRLNTAVRRPDVISEKKKSDNLKDKQMTEKIKTAEIPKFTSKSRGRRCLFKQAFTLPSPNEQNIRLDDVHFSKDLEPKSEAATRLFGQEAAQQNTQLNMPLPTPMEPIPLKEKLLALQTELPIKMKLSVEEVTMQRNVKQSITIPYPVKQNIRLDDIHFNKNLEPKSEVAKRLFEQESALQNTQLNMPLPFPRQAKSIKENLLDLGTEPSTEQNLSIEEAINQQYKQLMTTHSMENNTTALRANRLERQFLTSNEKTYLNNIPAIKRSLEKHDLSIRSDRHKDKSTLTQILQTLMSSTSNTSNQQNELDLKPEFQLEKPIASKASNSTNSELMNNLSNSRSSHLHYIQNRKMH